MSYKWHKKKKNINPLNKNGYSDLFSFNQDLSNINNRSSFRTEDFTSKKKNIKTRKNESLILFILFYEH